MDDIKGNNNLKAGRDINIQGQVPSAAHLKELWVAMRNKFAAIDDEINAMFPDSPQTSDQNRPFSCERLISSLVKLDIPVAVAMDVLDVLRSDLIRSNQTLLTTSDIRKAVSAVLHKLESDEYDKQKTQVWGDSYVRTYANCTYHVEVIYPDGCITVFDSEYVRSKLLHDMIDLILPQTGFARFAPFLPNNEETQIAASIMSAVEGLHLYRIHYDALLLLVKELALQPPHPWLIQKVFEYEAVLYDHSKAAVHARDVREYRQRDIAASLYAARECVHHSSSAILAYYGAWMGCGHMAPFRNLVHLVGHLDRKTPEYLEHYSRIGSICQDLVRNKLRLSDFLKILNNIETYLNTHVSSNPATIDRFVEAVEGLHRVEEMLLKMYIEVNALKRISPTRVTSTTEICDIAIKAISLLPGLSLQECKLGSHFWVEHDIRILKTRGVRARVLFVPIMTSIETRDADRYSAVLKKNEQVCNTCVFVTAENLIENWSRIAEAFRSKKLYALLVPVERIIAVAASENPPEALIKEVKDLMQRIGVARL
ncbi:MAG: hypothetical protein ABFD92_07795 [Planctomycetaceae bacterium]|nr:hypothetical protein [Planctomycetaceae bacterium]